MHLFFQYVIQARSVTLPVTNHATVLIHQNVINFIKNRGFDVSKIHFGNFGKNFDSFDKSFDGFDKCFDSFFDIILTILINGI